MVRGNRGFAEMIGTGGDGAGQSSARLPPRTGFLSGRENRLAELAGGRMVTRVHEFVDPVRCRIWEGHNRDYAALNETTCADLIESLRAQGRQEVPAIVRRLTGAPDHDYEVVCGARRHWSVSWLRTHNYPEFGFLIEARELTDEEAFRLADLENRHRKDLSDYERAIDYARAIDRYYGGSQQRMVERLEVNKSWLSRYLELARLPPQVVASFGSPHIIGISHAAALAPLLRVPKTQERVMAAAADLAAEQSARAKRGELHLPAMTVVRRLTAPAALKSARQSRRETVVRAEDGVILARGALMRGGSLSISIPMPRKRNRPQVLAAVAEIFDQIAGREEADPDR